MVESHLLAGNQAIPLDFKQLVYGQNITDACVDFDTTTTMLEDVAKAVEKGRLDGKVLRKKF